MKSPKRMTYLNRVESDFFSQKWYNRSVTLFCNLLLTSKWMRGAKTARCVVIEISEGGALIRAEKSQVPDQLYLIFGRCDVVVGCTVVQRDQGQIQLSFVKPLKPEFVNRLARLTSPFATLESLSPQTILAGSNQSTVRPMLPEANATPKASVDQTSKHSKTP